MLTQSVAERVIDKALGSGADFCEIFAEDRKELSIKMRTGDAPMRPGSISTVRACISCVGQPASMSIPPT